MTAYYVFLGVAAVQWILTHISKWKLLIYNRTATKENRLFIILICIEMIIFAALRSDQIGADTDVYIKALDYYKSLPHEDILKAKNVWPFDFEIGYLLLTKICAFLYFSETGFLLVIAMLIYIPICFFIYKQSEHPLISLVVYFAFGFWGYSLGIFRQMIAISIILVGNKYIKNRNLIKYLITVAVAMLFHQTAIVALPLYWLHGIKINVSIKWIFLAEILSFIFARAILMIIIRIFPEYSGYINSQYDIQGGSYIMLIILNLLLILGYYSILHHKKNNESLNICVNAMMVAVVLQVLGYSMNIFGRIVPFYSIYMLLLIPALINNYFQQKDRQAVRLIVLCGLLIVFYMTTKESVRLVPFVFNWE